MYSDGADDEIHQQATWQHAEVQCISAEHRNGPVLPYRRENYSDEDDHDDAQEEGSFICWSLLNWQDIAAEAHLSVERQEC